MLKKNTKLSQNCTKNQKPPKKKNSEKKVVTTMPKFALKKETVVSIAKSQRQMEK
jgi:hypothetical protein